MTSTKDLEPPGYGFNPTEEEIVNHYLPHMISGNHSQVSAIAEINNIRKYEPWDLPGLAKKPSSKHQWYFFSPRNSELCKRTTKAGSWKVTGQKYELKNRAKQLIIKRYLVFCAGRGSNAVRTNWKIHEYYLKPSYSNERGYVIYRLFQNQKSPKKIVNSAVDEGESDHDSASVVENHVTDILSPEIGQQLMDGILNSVEQDFTSPTEQQPKKHISQGPSFVNLQGTNGTIDYYNEPLSQNGISVQQDNTTESLATPHIGYVGYPEAVKATVVQCLPEMQMVQGLFHENFLLTNGTIGEYNLPWSQFDASGMQDNISELEKSYPVVPDVHSCWRSAHTAPSDSNPLESLESLRFDNFSDTGVVCSWFNDGIELAAGVDSDNLQQTNCVADECNLISSQFGTTPQQDDISELKSYPAIQDAHSYGGSMQIAPSDSSPSKSSGSQHVEDVSNTEADNPMFACFDAAPQVDNDWLWDWSFEPAPAYFP